MQGRSVSTGGRTGVAGGMVSGVVLHWVLRTVIWAKYKIKDQDVFDESQDYVKMYYWEVLIWPNEFARVVVPEIQLRFYGVCLHSVKSFRRN